MAEKSFITQELVDWVKSLARHGLLVVDASGRGDLSPQARELAGKLHELLASTADAKREMDAKLAAAVSSLGRVVAELPDSYYP